jgi:hypothetical protein
MAMERKKKKRKYQMAKVFTGILLLLVENVCTVRTILFIYFPV